MSLACAQNGQCGCGCANAPLAGVRRGMGFLSPFSANGGADDYWADPGAWLFDDWEYYDPVSETFYLSQSTSEPFASPNTGGGFDWQSLVDWWNWLTGGTPHSPAYTTPAQLPGYCPGGYYHPLNDRFACVPFPPDDPRSNQRSRPGAQRQRPRPRPQSQAPPCGKGPDGKPLFRDPRDGQCKPAPACPSGLSFNPQTLRCEQTLASRLTTPSYGGLPLWVLLLLGMLGLKAITSRSSSRGRHKR